MKKNWFDRQGIPVNLRKMFSGMKLRVVFILFLTFTISSAVWAQSKTVTLNVKSEPVSDVLIYIKDATGVQIIFNENQLEKVMCGPVSLKNVSVKEAIDAVLKGKTFFCEVLDGVYVIKRETRKEEVKKLTIVGKVVDVQNHPLPGVTVRIKGTMLGVATDVDGNYSIALTVEEEKPVLVFSFVGMTSKEVVYAGKDVINVTLEPETSEIDEVVVTGYQTISKERVTGAFDVVSVEQLSRPTSNIATRLIGMVAGMQDRLDKDGNLVFEVRGQTSLNTDARPLVVVDGFAVEDDFSSINPNDVESITILKDAAAASIWGARSANGVIVVTTKQGKAGKDKGTRIDVSAFVKLSPKLDLDTYYPFASSEEVVEYERKGFATQFFSSPWGGPIDDSYYNVTENYSQAMVAMNENRLGYLSDVDLESVLERLKKQDNRKQIKKYLLQMPITQQYNVNIAGKTERMNNMLSLMYEREKDHFKENKKDRVLVSYRTNVKLFRWLDFHFSGMFQYNRVDNSGSGNGILRLSPYDLLVDERGERLPVTYGYYMPILERHVPMDKFPYTDWTYNPITDIENQKLIKKQLNARLQGGMTIKFWQGFSLDSKIQYEMFHTANTNVFNEKTFTVRQVVNQAASWDKTTDEVVLNLPKGGMKNMSRSELEAYSFRNQLNFDHSFSERHDVSVIAGMEINQRVVQVTTNPTTYGYDDETLSVGIFPNGVTGTKNWMGRAQTFSYTNSFTYETDRYFSLFGNASYTFDSKYTISGSVRTDASNLITDDPKYRYAPFWSVGVSWQIGKERFMDGMEALDRLTMRVTYGYNGNVDKTTSFRPLIDLSATQDVYTHEFISSISSYGNPTLRWERTGTWNVGVDYAFWGGKLVGKLDVYNKHGKDLITSMTIPAVNGTTSQKLNAAEMVNRGIELEVGSRLPISGTDIVWTGSLNFSYNKNRITNLYRATYGAYNLYSGGTSAYVEGFDANTLWAYEYAGVVNRGTESDPIWMPAVYGTDRKEYDFSQWVSGDAREYMLNMGTKVAPYTLGISNAFKIYDFDVSFIVTGKFGHYFRRCSFNYPSMSGGRALPNKFYREVLEADPMEMAPIPFENSENASYYSWSSYYPYVDYLVESASHIRLREVYIGYNMPAHLLSKVGISSLQVYVQGNNLCSWFKNKYDEDPEYPTNANGGTIRPRASYTLGLKFNF